MDQIQPFQWVMAPFPVYGDWLYAWYTGKDDDGNYIVSFDPDGPDRKVKQIHPIN